MRNSWLTIEILIGQIMVNENKTILSFGINTKKNLIVSLYWSRKGIKGKLFLYLMWQI